MDNATLADLLKGTSQAREPRQLFICDEGILDGPNLPNQISEYFKSFEASLNLVCPPAFVRGGEEAKVMGLR